MKLIFQHKNQLDSIQNVRAVDIRRLIHKQQCQESRFGSGSGPEYPGSGTFCPYLH